mgnify:CR=1 FL=1|jgi:hypothetical protein|tara:strand:- start:522 stop:824 length:303 start_codon:yes stop_codon:yes gene_type:complete
MANIYFAGEKDTKKEAIGSVTEMIKSYCDCVCQAQVVSDDGGHVLEIMVEVGQPTKSLQEQKPEFPINDIIPKWHGWRAIILKVPVGYIGTVVNATEDGY